MAEEQDDAAVTTGEETDHAWRCGTNGPFP